MIKIIHQTWKTNNTPEKMTFCIESWKNKNKSFRYMFWTDSDINYFIKTNYPQYLDILNTVKTGIQKADIFRILALYHFGGLYVDIDFECLTPVDTWNLNYNKVNLGNEPFIHHKKDVLCNALIYSPPKMSCLLKILEHGRQVIKKNPAEVMKSFGPIAWQTVLGGTNDINIISSDLIYPLPDITINKKLEDKYSNKIKNKDYDNSWAVHYWEHSNYNRTNILNKYQSFLIPKNIINSISICGIFRNNEKYLKNYLIPKLDKIIKIYSYIKFYFYFYENDSTDNTKNILKKFCDIHDAVLFSENINASTFKRNTSIGRINNICNCRNKLLNMRPFNGDWTIIIDSDIYFPDNLIDRFIAKKIPNDLVALTSNGKDHVKCKNHNNCNHYYDTLSLIFSDNSSGFSHFLKTGSKCCPFKDQIDINKWTGYNLVKVNSSFGGLAIYKTSVLNNTIIKYTSESHINTNHYCEHIGFNKKLRNYGNIYIDPTIIVKNIEN